MIPWPGGIALGPHSPIELMDHGCLSVASHHHLLLFQLLSDLCNTRKEEVESFPGRRCSPPTPCIATQDAVPHSTYSYPTVCAECFTIAANTHTPCCVC